VSVGEGEPIGVLEVPDNGSFVDYVTVDEMIEIFGANWDGGALNAPAQFSFGWHSSASAASREKVEGFLQHADQFLAARDAGPVVYGRVSDMVKVWPSR
jgi:hypothetical protein